MHSGLLGDLYSRIVEHHVSLVTANGIVSQAACNQAETPNSGQVHRNKVSGVVNKVQTTRSDFQIVRSMIILGNERTNK